MPRKLFDCKACGQSHERPINSKCTKNNVNNATSDNNVSGAKKSDINIQILQELKSLSGRMTVVEQKVDASAGTSSQLQHRQPQAPSDSEEDSEDIDDAVTPSLEGLRKSAQIQAKVEERLAELQAIQNKGKFRSQRGGPKDNYWCKKEVPWPQNFILSGTTKSRTTYDSLTMSQWVSGFSHIIREETDPQTKNFMLDYLSDIMDDSQDFGWPSAKGAHAVLLCQMEQDKIQWHETSKIDRVRRAHAQKISQNPHQNQKRSNKPMPCKYYQKGTCGQSNDHEHNGQMYLHACSTCYSSGKTYPHPSRECRRAKND